MLLTGFDGARESGEGAELLGIEPLEEYARRLAALLTPGRQRARGARAHLQRLAAHAGALRQIYTALEDDARAGEATPPAAEWLLDNFHIISAAIRDIRGDLPPSFYRRLPAITADEFAGLPRVVRHGAGVGALQRRAPRRPARAPVRQRLPVGNPADDRRAVGVAERVEARAGRTAARPCRGHRGRPRAAAGGRPARGDARGSAARAANAGRRVSTPPS